MSAAIGRLLVYLAEMHPLPQRLLAALALYAGLATLLARLHGHPADLLAHPLRTALGAWAAFAAMLILRLMDELKDVDTDRRLFPGRPLPSGRVRATDVAGLLVVTSALFLLAHAWAGVLASSALVLGYAWLMFRWFFVPDRMRPRLLTTLFTHQPIVPLVLLDLALLAAAQHGISALRPAAVATTVAVFWCGLFAWEIARKIRAPEQEDAYVTYSRRLGGSQAVLLTAGVQGASAAVACGLWLAGEVGPGLPLALLAGLAPALYAHVRFLRHPAPEHATLRPFAEAHVFATCVGGALA